MADHTATRKLSEEVAADLAAIRRREDQLERLKASLPAFYHALWLSSGTPHSDSLVQRIESFIRELFDVRPEEPCSHCAGEAFVWKRGVPGLFRHDRRVPCERCDGLGFLTIENLIRQCAAPNCGSSIGLEEIDGLLVCANDPLCFEEAQRQEREVR